MKIFSRQQEQKLKTKTVKQLTDKELNAMYIRAAYDNRYSNTSKHYAVNETTKNITKYVWYNDETRANKEKLVALYKARRTKPSRKYYDDLKKKYNIK